MSTLAEIENAADALSPEAKERRDVDPRVRVGSLVQYGQVVH
jgi:hypothetical protein